MFDLEMKGIMALRRIWIVLIVVSIFGGCAGGTAGTGLSYGSRSGGAGDIKYRMFRGRVVSQSGKPLSSLTVEVRSSTGSESTRVDSSGRFSVIVGKSKSERFTTTFEGRGGSWTLTLKDVPSSEVKLILKNSGAVGVER